jgi:hypothetical protein
VNWLIHNVELPQYEPNFRRHAVDGAKVTKAFMQTFNSKIGATKYEGNKKLEIFIIFCGRILFTHLRLFYIRLDTPKVSHCEFLVDNFFGHARQKSSHLLAIYRKKCYQTCC